MRRDWQRQTHIITDGIVLRACLCARSAWLIPFASCRSGLRRHRDRGSLTPGSGLMLIGCHGFVWSKKYWQNVLMKQICRDVAKAPIFRYFLSLTSEKTYPAPLRSSRHHLYCSFCEVSGCLLSAQEEIRRCGRACVIMLYGLCGALIKPISHAHKAFPDTRKVVSMYAVLAMCWYLMFYVYAPKTAHTQTIGGLFASARFSETCRCPYSPPH